MSAPISPMMNRELAPQPVIKDNGCFCLCFGKQPGPVDPKRITDDGGKYVQTEDGRIVEYFLYGSEDPKAPVFIQINGSMGTGWFPANLGLVNAKMIELNVRGLSITIPGYGYTSMFPEGYKLGDWPKLDVDPVLAAEGMHDNPLLVEGSSYGAGLALALMSYYGDRISHAHLHVPYVDLDTRREQKMPDKIGDDAFFDQDTAWANSCSSCYIHCLCQCCMGCCLLHICGMGALDDDETLTMEKAAPGSTHATHYDIQRAMRFGKNTYGWVHNAVGGLISKNWGFEVKSIKPAKTRVLISYNIGDTQTAPVETLPANPHGAFLVEHFTAYAAKCVANVGGGENKPNQHGAQMYKLVNGDSVAQLMAM